MKLNDDGLIPGQQVDFETMMRIQRERALKAKQPKTEEPEVKRRGRPRKNTDADSGSDVELVYGAVPEAPAEEA